jgi:hypothetical protein
MLEVNVPKSVPSTVLLSSMVGLPVVFQQTPRAVMPASPVDVTSPPEFAVVCVVFVMFSDEIDGKVCVS